MKDTFETIKALCEAKGVSGRESSAVNVLKKILKEYKCETDPLGNLIVTIREAGEAEKTVLFEAHIDRIGLMVSHITQDGLLNMIKVGGVDAHTLMASEVVIDGKKGEVTGVFGLPFPYPAKPHNTVGDSEREMPKIDEMLVDIGYEKPNDYVRLGNEVIMKSEVIRLLGTRIAAPCLDDRACCAAIIKAAELSKDGLNCGLKLLFSTREEIGAVGAKTGVFSLNADMAIAVDANFAVSPDVEDDEGTELGKGVQIDIASVLDNELTEKLIETAKREKIDCQLFVDGRRTGTDADEIAVVARGVRTALLSLPLRFMHHPTVVIDLEDVEKTAALMAAFVKEIK